MSEMPDATALIELALSEDMPTGDITSDLTVPEDLKGRAEFHAKGEIVVCGLGLIEKIAAVAKFPVTVTLKVKDGDLVKPGTVLAVCQGKLKHLLSLERTALNFLQRLSGIATLSKLVSSKAKGFYVCDTRKTTPGWRALEKYAVRVGGARNHRTSLSDMVLIKNNHIDAHGGDVKATLAHVFKNKPKGMQVEVEVRNLAEIEALASFSPDIIMLDNMKGEVLKQAVKKVKELLPKSKIELSGGITTERFPEFEELGIDYISMGALTHSAKAVDISMRLARDQTAK